MCSAFNGSLFTTIVSWSHERQWWISCQYLLQRAIFPCLTNSKRRILIMGGDMNAQIGKDINDKFCLYVYSCVEKILIHAFTKEISVKVKRERLRPGFERGFPYPFPKTIAMM